MKMIIILTTLFIVLLVYIIYFLSVKNQRAENEIDIMIKSRLSFIEKDYRKNQESLFKLKIKEWESDNEFDIRRTAIKNMNSSMLDVLSKELKIISNNFVFNPKDIKFVGRYIDLIIFDGAFDREFVNIYFVEIVRPMKISNQIYRKKIAEAISKNKVTFQEIRI